MHVLASSSFIYYSDYSDFVTYIHKQMYIVNTPGRAGSRPVPQMPMHLSDFARDAYLTVCIGQILMLLLLLSLVLLLARKGSSLTITS